MQGEDLRRNLRQCTQDPDLDGTDRHAPGQDPAHAVNLRMASVQLHGPASPATVRLPRSVEVDQRPLPTAGNSVTAAGVGLRLTWTAETPRKAIPLKTG